MCSVSDGPALPNNGSVLKVCHRCWPVCPHHWYFLYTPSYPLTLPHRSFRDGIPPSSCPILAGAIFSGFAMVLTLMLVVRKIFHLEDYITLVAYRVDEQDHHSDRFYCGCSLHYRALYRLVFSRISMNSMLSSTEAWGHMPGHTGV